MSQANRKTTKSSIFG